MMEFFTQDWLSKPVWMWFGFLAVVLVLLILDLGVLHRKEREIGVRESLLMTMGYMAVGLLFGGWVWWQIGQDAGLQYLTGFVVEKSLAMDNVFVIAMIFTYFAVPRLYQHRVLFWGILGVIVLRGIMIGAGATLVAEFSWLLYLFAAFLIITGIKMWWMADQPTDLANNRVLNWLRTHLPVTERLHGHDFWVRTEQNGVRRWMMTPLFLALMMVEIVDVVFAVDSVPAIFAITTDPFLVYTSNIFAILGLRALYFALSAMIDRFHYLKYALSVLLVFIGAKIFVADWAGFPDGKFPPEWGLAITFAILGTGIAWSWWKTKPIQTS